MEALYAILIVLGLGALFAWYFTSNITKRLTQAKLKF